MRKLTKKASIVVASGSAVAVLGSGVAYAYWTASGSGTGSASTSSGASDLTVSQTSSISDLHPGDTAQTISGTIRNNASSSAYVTGVTASIASVVKAAGAPSGTCDANDYTLASPEMGVGQDISGGSTVSFSGATIKFNNTTSNQDACKGATVNLAYAAH